MMVSVVVLENRVDGVGSDGIVDGEHLVEEIRWNGGAHDSEEGLQ